MSIFTPGISPGTTQYITPIKEDIIKGAQASQTLYETRQIRVFQVWGLSSFASNARPSIAINANGIPRLGESALLSRALRWIEIDVAHQ